MVEGCAWRNWLDRLCFLQWCLVMARDGNGVLQDGLTFLSPSNVIAAFRYTSSTCPARSQRMSWPVFWPVGVRRSNWRISSMIKPVSEGLVCVM